MHPDLALKYTLLIGIKWFPFYPPQFRNIPPIQPPVRLQFYSLTWEGKIPQTLARKSPKNNRAAGSLFPGDNLLIISLYEVFKEEYHNKLGRGIFEVIII